MLHAVEKARVVVTICRYLLGRMFFFGYGGGGGSLGVWLLQNLGRAAPIQWLFVGGGVGVQEGKWPGP